MISRNHYAKIIKPEKQNVGYTAKNDRMRWLMEIAGKRRIPSRSLPPPKKKGCFRNFLFSYFGDGRNLSIPKYKFALYRIVFQFFLTRTKKLEISRPLESKSVKYWWNPTVSVTLLWFVETVAECAKTSDFANFFLLILTKSV